MEKVQITPSSITLTLALVATAALTYMVRDLLVISLIGVGLGVLIAPILRSFHKKTHLPKGLAAFIVLLLLLTLIGVVLSSLYYLVAGQANDLVERGPELLAALNQRAEELFKNHPWLRGQVEELNLGGTFRTGLLGIFQGFRSGVLAVGLGLFTITLALYTGLQSEDYFEKLVEAFPPRHHNKVRSVLLESGHVLRHWFSAQVLDMSITGLLTGVGLMLAGVPYWAVFGLLTAIMQIIPYVGMFLVIITASFITLASDPSKLPLMLAVFILVQNLENHLILPLVMKGRANLPVVPLLIFVMIMGSLFGLLGVFIATGLFSVLRVFYIRLYLQRWHEN